MSTTATALAKAFPTAGVVVLFVLARVPGHLPAPFGMGGWVARLALLIAAVSGARALVRAPLAVVQALRRQPRLRSWIAVEARTMVATVVVGSALTVPLYALLRATPAWWVFAWMLFAVVTVAAQGVFPFTLRIVVGPVTPADDALTARVQAIAARAGVDSAPALFCRASPEARAATPTSSASVAAGGS